MSYKRIIPLVVLAATFLSAAPRTAAQSSSVAVAQQPAAYQAPTVSAKDARSAAAWQAVAHTRSEENTAWKNKTIQVGKATKVNDVDGDLVAYLVQIRTNGLPSGWVMVSAFLDEEPIIMWGDQGSVIEPKRLKEKLGDKARLVINEDVVWLGGPQLAAQFELQDASIHTVSQDGEVKSGAHTGWYKLPEFKNENARRFWGVVNKMQLAELGTDTDGVTDVNPDAWEAGYDSIIRGYLDDSHGINQKQWAYDGYNWTGCSPTAGSNIMVYWANKGYPNLNPTGNQQDIVMSLRMHMQTSQATDGTGVTDPFVIDNGLQNYAVSYGYSTAYSWNDNLASYTSAMTEINAGRPFLLNTGGNAYFNGGHTVFVVGFKEYEYGLFSAPSSYLVFRNNFPYETSNGMPTHNLYIRWGAWSTWSLTKFNPAT